MVARAVPWAELRQNSVDDKMFYSLGSIIIKQLNSIHLYLNRKNFIKRLQDGLKVVNFNSQAEWKIDHVNITSEWKILCKNL